MATDNNSSPKIYEKGQTCLYKDELHVVTDVSVSVLGFRLFSIQNLRNGAQARVQKHMLSPADTDFLPEGRCKK